MGHPTRRSDDGNGKLRPKWEPSITLGGLLNLGAIIVSATLAYSSLKESVSTLRENVEGKIAVLATEIGHLKSSFAEIKSEHRDLTNR